MKKWTRTELIQHIRVGIETKGRRHVFENWLDEIWTPDRGDRSSQMRYIRRFAAKHGWAVGFRQGGREAIFRPATSADLCKEKPY